MAHGARVQWPAISPSPGVAAMTVTAISALPRGSPAPAVARPRPAARRRFRARATVAPRQVRRPALRGAVAASAPWAVWAREARLVPQTAATVKPAARKPGRAELLAAGKATRAGLPRACPIPTTGLTEINQNTHHIWVDHCDFTKAEDGLFDITRQSSFITISWNKFYEHSKTMLIGHSDAETGDVGHLKTTIHHNFFNATEQRHPRVRFGEVHVFNNYFLSNNLYGVASTMDAKVVVEGNYFENVPHPTHSGYQESGPGDLVERNNAYINSGTPETRGTAFDPKAAYPYVVENPMTLPALLRSKAGAGVIDPMAVVK
jgi:hypothetical protein